MVAGASNSILILVWAKSYIVEVSWCLFARLKGTVHRVKGGGVPAGCGSDIGADWLGPSLHDREASESTESSTFHSPISFRRPKRLISFLPLYCVNINMHPFHLSSTSRALYRVFVVPNLHSIPSTRRAFIASPNPFPRPLRPFGPLTTVRTKVYKKRDTARHALSDEYTLDAAIKASHVNLIGADGVFHRDVTINEALRMYDRVQYHLVLVSPGVVDEFGVSDANNPPVCKIVSKMELRSQHQKKLDIERRKTKGGSGPSQKSLELNWAIAPGDLKHRLTKIQQFLSEGRKVEVLLAPKRRGRVATDKECNEVLKSVRDAVDEIRGAGEVKEPDGKIGGLMTLIFEGRKIKENAKSEAPVISD